MRIGIDAMLLWGEWTGIGRAIWELAKRFSQDACGHEFVLYSSRGFKRKRELAGPQFQIKRTWFHARRRTLRILWEQFRLPWRAVKDELQILHAPAYIMPVMSMVPVVATVHDVIPLKHPDLVRKSTTSHLERFLPKTLERAQLVTVPTKAVARDLKDLYDIRDDKIRVIPFGVGSEFKPIEDHDARAQARDALNLPNPYVSFVGRVEPKKNLARVLEAYFAATVSRQLPHDLVMVGPRATSKPLDKLIRQLGIAGRVRHLGYVPDADLPTLYACADVLLFPSKAEGFGFPLLEAMACGTPCVISKDPALVELSGGAALKAKDDNLPRLRELIERVLLNPEEAGRLRALGIARASEYTWERAAQLTLDAYEEARARFERSLPAAHGDRKAGA